MKKEEIQAICLMVGTIIGAGVLALPYAVSKVGVFLGVGMLIILGLIVVLLNLYMGEIVLRTKKIHEISGYAEKYIGKWGKKFITISMFIGIVGGLVAYIIGEGEALQALFGWDKFWFSLIFFGIMAALVFFDLGGIVYSEILLVVSMLVILLGIIVFSLPSINVSNFFHSDISKILIPYGVMLFALFDLAVIPEMASCLKRNKKKLKRNIIIGASIPLIIYIIFAVVAVGVAGLSVSEIVTISLGDILGKHVLILGNLFAVFAMATSFLTLGLALKWILTKDYEWNDKIAWLFAMSIPFVIFLLGLTSFISAILVTGAIAGGLDSIIVIYMFNKAKKLGDRKPEYSIKSNVVLNLVLVGVFLIGIGWTIWSLF